MLGAGNAGSMSHGVSVNMVQFGNKLQGLAPTATNYFITRGSGQNYRKRTAAPKRDYIFCMNQLGGVGRNRSQFNSSADGVSNCTPGLYNDLLGNTISFLKNYFSSNIPDYTLCLVGEYEKVGTDLAGCCSESLSTTDNSPFAHLTDESYYYDTTDVSDTDQASLSLAFYNTNIHDKVKYVNSMCSYIEGFGCFGGGSISLGTHTLGLVPKSKISSLNTCGYGVEEWQGLGIYKWPNAAGCYCCWLYSSEYNNYQIYACDGTTTTWQSSVSYADGPTWMGQTTGAQNCYSSASSTGPSFPTTASDAECTVSGTAGGGSILCPSGTPTCS